MLEKGWKVGRWQKKSGHVRKMVGCLGGAYLRVNIEFQRKVGSFGLFHIFHIFKGKKNQGMCEK